MKYYFLHLFGWILISCCFLFSVQAQDNSFLLSAEQFASVLATPGNHVILDVRTPDEFKEGHIEKAVNYDWNGDHFFDQISALNKKESIYVYCFSGGRSGEAAAAMREKGFKKVFELQGGIRKWRAAGLPEVKGNESSKGQGMTRAEFEALLSSDKVVLIDFYADWCAPCKKLRPILYQVSKERKDVVVRPINADANRFIAKELNVEALPTLLLYQQQKLIWKNEGLVSKQEILSHLPVAVYLRD